MKHLKECSFCKRKVFKLACRKPQDLCAACYYRNKRNATLEYVKVRKPCSIDGCDALAVGSGYCDKHYRRFRKHGTPTPDAAENWGHSHGHPMYDRWRWIRQRRSQPIDPAWANDFWQFVRDIGDPPSPRHTLRRIDERAPYGPANFYWREPSTEVPLTDKQAHAEYQRAYRIAQPHILKNLHLKKSYGIDLAEFNRMLTDQNGGCAICGRPEKRKGKPLAVDHCHTSKHVRGLLCSACNTLIGLADESVARLESAVAYLKKHAAKKVRSGQ